MRRVVSNVAIDFAEMNKRLAALGKAFPDVEFSSQDHETRQQIVVDSDEQIDTPEFESMVRIANGG